MTDQGVNTPSGRGAMFRIAAAIALAMAFALGVYLLLNATRPNTGLVSFSFLLVLPAVLSAFVAYVADPWASRSHGSYMLVPFWLLCATIVASVVFLREGVICILILSPLWMLSGIVGAEITYRLRKRTGDGRSYCIALIALPLVAIQVEPMIPIAQAEAVVTRSIDVAATPAEIWPLLKGIPDVHPGEGCWNVAQDIIGIPRPIGARLVGAGIGADRFANWGEQIRFRERITAWDKDRRLEWRFIFDDIRGWQFTDRHLMPDSPYFRVTTGGYRMTPMANGHTRITLDTRYRITTPVNAYSELWGQLLLGDVENNLLSLVKQRAEHRDGPGRKAEIG